MAMNLPEIRRRLEAQSSAPSPRLNLTRGPRVPTDWKAALEIARAVRDGDHVCAKELIEAFVGRPLDTILAEAYGAETWVDLTDWQRGILPAFVWFLDYHKERMGTESKEWYKKRAKYVASGLKKRDDQDLMRSLRIPGEGREQRLERLMRELPGAVMMEEANGYFGCFILGPVERRIIKDNRLLRDTRKKPEPGWEGGSTDRIVSLENGDSGLHGGHAHHADPSPEDQFLESFAEMEHERRRDHDSKKFTPTEQRIAEFLRHEYAYRDGGPTPEQAIAFKFGLADSTARVHIKNMKDKFSA